MRRRQKLSFLPFLLILLLPTVGCDEERGAAGEALLVSPASAQQRAGTEDLAPAPPTLEAINEAVGADARQARALASAYEDWSRAIEQRRATRLSLREQRRGGDPPQGDPEPERVRPAQAFLVRASAVLVPSQMVELIELLGEHRREAREQMRAQRGDRVRGERRFAPGPRAGRRDGGPGPGRGPGRALFSELDLGPAQRESLRALHEETRAAMRELLEAVEPGETLSEELRAQAHALRQEQREQVAAILTEEQMAQLEQLRTELRLETAERGEERFEAQLQQRLEFLSAVLHLSDEQRARIEQVSREHHDGVADERRTENWEHGGPLAGLFPGPSSRASARVELDVPIAAVLDSEQKLVFEALRAWAAGPGERGPAHGPGGGRWGRGGRQGGPPRGRG